MDGNGYKVTLKGARVSAGLNQDEACREIGVSKATLVKYESGKTAPTLPTLKKMCEVYNVPIGSISFTRMDN